MSRKTKSGRSSPQRRKAHKTKERPRRDSGLLGPAKLQQLYMFMLHCRLIEEEVRRLAKEGRIAGSHGSTGQEATEVGAIIGLKSNDCCAPRRRNLVAGYILGIPLKTVFAQILASTPGPSASARPAPNTHFPLIISGAAAMAARLNISTGVALAHKAQKKPGVVVAFSGDDSMALPSWREAVDFAVQQRLPIVHVVQDDLGGERSGTDSPFRTNSNESGIPTLIVDGNDVVAVYRVVQEAVRRAREGHGPTLIECKTPRWAGYSGIAPAQIPPSRSGRHHISAADPIASMEAYLAQKGLWSEAWKQKLVRSFQKQLAAAVHFAERRHSHKAAI